MLIKIDNKIYLANISNIMEYQCELEVKSLPPYIVIYMLHKKYA
nr:MAG TPA_asm: hypothetical protein [Caudoviricetes sp.]